MRLGRFSLFGLARYEMEEDDFGSFLKPAEPYSS